jgi:hypothetical protein
MNQITTTFLVGGSDVEVTAQCSGLSAAVYFAKCDAVCVQPKMVGSYVAGDKHLFVEAEMPNGTKVVASSGEEAYLHDGKAAIKLTNRLIAGQSIFVRIDSVNCKTESCKMIVGEMAANGCEVASVFQAAGVMTGEMVCLGKDLYRLSWDGNGGKVPSVPVQDDCIYCGGVNPQTGSTGGGDTGGGAGGEEIITVVRLEDTAIVNSNGLSGSRYADSGTLDNSRTGGLSFGMFAEWVKAHSEQKVLTEVRIRYKAYGNTEPGTLQVKVNNTTAIPIVLDTEEVWRTVNVLTDVQALSHTLRLTVASHFSIQFDYIELKLQSVV